MLAPLPDELNNHLLDLAECGVYAAVDQYTDDETKLMEKLLALGLVAKGWALTPARHQRVRAQKEQDANTRAQIQLDTDEVRSGDDF